MSPPAEGGRARARASRFFSIFAVLAALAALPLPLPRGMAIPLLAAVMGFLPGAIAAEMVLPATSRAQRLLFGLVLSPLLAGGLAAAAMVSGVSPAASGRIVAALLALGAIGLALVRDRAHGRDPQVRPGARVAEEVAPLFWIAIGWTALMGGILIGNPALVSRSDGWFHAAVSLQIAGHGLPPEDPFFAGLRLFYFWGPHAWASIWNALQPSLSVWTPFIVMNLAGAFASILGIGLLARRLGARRDGITAAAVAAMLGNAPFAWGWIVAPALRGSVRGWTEVARIVGGGIEPALSAMSTGMLHISMVFFGGKFLVLTPFGLGFGLFAAFLAIFLDFVAARDGRRGVALSLLTAGGLFLHTVIGLCCVALAAGWWGYALILSRRSKDRGPRRALVPLLLSIAAGVALVSPYLAAILGGGGRQIGIGITRPALVTWLWCGAAVVPIGTYWLAKRARAEGAARDTLVLSILLTMAGLVLVLTDNNQSKFMNLLFYMMAAPAGIAWLELAGRLRGIARAALVIGLAGAVLPTAGFSLWAYAVEKGAFVRIGSELSVGEREAYAWARAHTKPATIFVEETGARDAPVLAARSVLWGGPTWARKWGYPAEALRMREGATRALSEGAVTPEIASFLAGLGRPIVIAAHRREATDPAAAWNALPRLPDAYRPIYSGADVVLYEWIQTTSWRR